MVHVAMTRARLVFLPLPSLCHRLLQPLHYLIRACSFADAMLVAADEQQRSLNEALRLCNDARQSPLVQRLQGLFLNPAAVSKVLQLRVDDQGRLLAAVGLRERHVSASHRSAPM